jgi:hypothetical protein
MEFGEYKATYLNLQSAIIQARIVGLASTESLKGFPKRLPPEVRRTVVSQLREFTQQLGEAVNALQESGEASRRIEDAAEADRSRLFSPTLQLFMLQVLRGRPIAEIDFDFVLNDMQLVLLLAYFEGFLSDSLKAACSQDIRTLYSGRKMSIERVLSSGNWEGLVARVIDDFAYESGWKALPERLLFLTSELGLDLQLLQAELDELKETELLRNLVVHNGSRVSQEYLDRTSRRDRHLGETVLVSGESVEKLTHLLQRLASDVYTAISTKFFKVSLPELGVIWQRPSSRP